jgi:hypothetical protein
VPDVWTFAGWIYQHGEENASGPVSAAVLRQLLNAGQLERTDLAWKCFKKGKETQFSSPVQVQQAAQEDNSGP